MLTERKFTAYSGTLLENFRECTYYSEGQLFYSKSDSRFRYPEGVYYTSKIKEAAKYAYSLTFDSRVWVWEQKIEEPGDRYTPLIMCGQLSLWRRFLPPGPKSILIFPVESILIPDIDIVDEAEHFDRRGSWTDLSPYFKPIDIQQVLVQNV